MKNIELRNIAKQSGVHLWELADKIGITDGTMSRRLRKELPEAEQRRMVALIKEVAAEKRLEEHDDGEAMS